MDPHLQSTVERCRQIPTSTWSDALDVAGLPGIVAGFIPRSGTFPVAGPLLTVTEEVSSLGSFRPEEFGIEHILSAAKRGQVLLIQQTGQPAASALGGVAALHARRHGIACVIIDGACRDLSELEETGLPVLSRDVTPVSGRGRVRITGIGNPVALDPVHAQAGDLAVVDATGVAILAANRLEELLPLAEDLAVKDAKRAAAAQR